MEWRFLEVGITPAKVERLTKSQFLMRNLNINLGCEAHV